MKSILKTLLSFSLILSAGLCMAQQMHCIPIEESRRLHEDALRAKSQEAILVNDAKQIDLLIEEKEQIRMDMNQKIELSEEKFKKQVEITEALNRKISILETESGFYRDKYKRQKILNGLKVIGIGISAAAGGYLAGKIF